MGDDLLNKNYKMISSLFHERSKFIVIGLTGRTGSGCTTAASILERKTPGFPRAEDVRVGSEPFFSGLDARRYKVVSKYSTENYKEFVSIKVSDLISAYILCMTPELLLEFILGVSEGVDKAEVERIISNGVFAKTPANRSAFKALAGKVLDHGSDGELNVRESNSFFLYMAIIRNFTGGFKSELMGLENKLYVKIYQAAGNSIRRIGKVQPGFASMDFEPESVFHLPETINRVIKNIRRIKSDGAFIVVDAIRNPYEAKYFKDRYSAFYLVSINAPNDDRKSYLQHVHKYTVEEFDDLERRESGKTDISDADFISQNVKKCIEISDIHIFNPRNELENNNVLMAQLAWYVALMQHPGLISPTSLERVMQIAYTAKVNSGCISRQVGAVVTDENYSIKSVGWNDVAKGQVPCNLRSLNGLGNDFDEVTYSVYERNNKAFRAAANIELIKVVSSEGVKGKI